MGLYRTTGTQLVPREIIKKILLIPLVQL